jgi:hypothetical protein
VDSNDLSLTHRKAGEDYLAALEGLGLRPVCLFWAWDKTVTQLVLVLVTYAFDYAGPLKLSETLFKAYNKAATPKEIDPFLVRLHSPQHAIIGELGKFLPFKGTQMTHKNGQPIIPPVDIISMKTDTYDLEVHSDWVYRFEKSTKVPASIELARRWRRFESKIEDLAA